MTVSFAVDRREAVRIEKIAMRALNVFLSDGGDLSAVSLESIEMDLTACHANGCPLDLEKLEGFNDANLMHDVFGIRRHIDRTNGQLQNCFVPRCALPEA